jgi:hypothetical protein
MTAFIGRREFITLLGGAAIAWPHLSFAQCRVGVLANEPWPPLFGLRDRLGELGYIEKQNLARVSGRGRTERAVCSSCRGRGPVAR